LPNIPSSSELVNDASLIALAVEGDTGAFGQLVEKYQHRLFNTLLPMAASREEAEDLTQDAFVQAFTKLHTFQQQSAFYTWLYRIAFNLALGRKRRRRRVEISVEQAREVVGLEPVDDGDAPGERLERTERVAQVREALESMSEEHRAILVLREMEGCCYETIAEILELPVGTVRSRLHRARIQLRDQLQEVLREHSPDS
jgi:RNA polymerase sigma-70 factor (ECF subfamily)